MAGSRPCPGDARRRSTSRSRTLRRAAPRRSPRRCCAPDARPAEDSRWSCRSRISWGPFYILPGVNPLRRPRADGRPILGYLVTMPGVQLVQALARTGVDWLMIDTEHAPIGIESVAAMIAATAGTPATPL